ncbi:MAG TPA: hypothetical protein VJN21_11000 [Candidatus Acidoferrales bacterium]|nr:hypothetical protein [Candidatus Acidoferrales bacterium]
MKLRIRWVASLLMLFLLCLPAAANAGGTGFALEGQRVSPSPCAASPRRAGGNSIGFIVGATAAPFESEPSTGLLLVIGLGLIGGASLIGAKAGRSEAAEERENADEKAIFSRPAVSLYRKPAPTMHISTKA